MNNELPLGDFKNQIASKKEETIRFNREDLKAILTKSFENGFETAIDLFEDDLNETYYDKSKTSSINEILAYTGFTPKKEILKSGDIIELKHKKCINCKVLESFILNKG